MTDPEVTRARLVRRIDALLGRWLVSAADKAFLRGLRLYVLQVSQDELERLDDYLPSD